MVEELRKANPTTDFNAKCSDAIGWFEKQGHTDTIIEKAKTEKQRVIISETNE